MNIFSVGIRNAVEDEYYSLLLCYFHYQLQNATLPHYLFFLHPDM